MSLYRREVVGVLRHQRQHPLHNVLCAHRLGFRVQGLEFGVWGLGSEVWSLGLGVCGSRFRGWVYNIVIKSVPFRVGGVQHTDLTSVSRTTFPQFARFWFPEAWLASRSDEAAVEELMGAAQSVEGWTPLSTGYGTCKTVKARFWPRLAGKSPSISFSCSLFARKRASRGDREQTEGLLPASQGQNLALTVYMSNMRDAAVVKLCLSRMAPITASFRCPSTAAHSSGR